LQLRPQTHRATQIGLISGAVSLYVNCWIRQFTEITTLAHEICTLVEHSDCKLAEALLPEATVYILPERIAEHIQSTLIVCLLTRGWNIYDFIKMVSVNVM